MTDLEISFKPNPEVMSTALPDGGSVLLDLDSELYFGLNPVGTRIWALIGEGRSAGEIVDLLADEHPSQEQGSLELDLWDLIEQLRERALVVVVDDVA